MNNLCCPCKCSCTLVSVVVSLIVGVIAAFLQITGVFTLTPTALVAVLAVAAVYLGGVTLTTLLQCRCDRVRCCCGSWNALLVGLLGTAFLAALLLAVGITATSVVSAILVGILIGFVSLSLLVSACLVRCLTACGE